jgi:hypothetical protein
VSPDHTSDTDSDLDEAWHPRAGNPRQLARANVFSDVKPLAGVDENGLGPRLGPLIVTGAWALATLAGAAVVVGQGPGVRPTTRANGDPSRHTRWPGEARLGDSKKLVAFGDSALGEAWARAIAARRGETPGTPEELLRTLSIDGDAALRARCPSDHEAQCWSGARERFDASLDLVATVTRDLTSLEEAGIDVRGVRLAIVCTERLNHAAARGLSRFDVDLHAMERIALDLREEAGADIDVTCGKVGGLGSYRPRFGHLSSRAMTTLEEGRARSTYQVSELGRLAFVRDADDTHVLVCLASLVGKWARDLLMNRIVRYHRDHNAELPIASGYHDPVTARFVSASALARRTRALPDTCFERTRARSR